MWNYGLFYHCQSATRRKVNPGPIWLGLAFGLYRDAPQAIVPDYLYLVFVPVCSLILAVFLAHAVSPAQPPDRGDGAGLRSTPSVNRQLCADRRRRMVCGFLYAHNGDLPVSTRPPRIVAQMIQSMGQSRCGR